MLVIPPLAPFKLSHATYLPEKLFHLSNIKYKFLLFVFYLLIDEEGDLKIIIGIKGLEFVICKLSLNLIIQPMNWLHPSDYVYPIYYFSVPSPNINN